MQVCRPLKILFSCECDVKKANWLLQAFPHTVFEDMNDLGTGKAFDLGSRSIQTVPKAGQDKTSHTIEFARRQKRMFINIYIY